MFADFKPETASKGTPEIIPQKAMTAVIAPPMPIAVYDLQANNFLNFGRSIVKTSDFMKLDLAKIETAVPKLHNFDQLVGFKAELLLPDISNLNFVHPDQTSFNQQPKSRLMSNPCRPLTTISSKS